MKERERFIVTSLVLLMLVFWLGFLVHRSPRFPGSMLGGVLGVSGALLMLVPLAYLVIKRIRILNQWITRFVPMRTLLAWHIYAGVLGPILVLLHSSHKFDSSLGIALITMTLIVVLSGFTGRYLLAHFSETIHEKREILTQLEINYRQVAAELAGNRGQLEMLRPLRGLFARWVGNKLMLSNFRGKESPAPMRALALVDAIAEIEYAIKMHESFKMAFQWWLRFHITIAFVLYLLLAAHVWAGIYFGLRWFT
jgi:hypothetical protein